MHQSNTARLRNATTIRDTEKHSIHYLVTATTIHWRMQSDRETKENCKRKLTQEIEIEVCMKEEERNLTWASNMVKNRRKHGAIKARIGEDPWRNQRLEECDEEMELGFGSGKRWLWDAECLGWRNEIAWRREWKREGDEMEIKKREIDVNACLRDIYIGPGILQVY